MYELLINFSCKLKVTKQRRTSFLRVTFVHDLLNYTNNREEEKRIVFSAKHYNVSKAQV